ncbi:protein of unknown function [Caballeronia sp. S22]
MQVAALSLNLSILTCMFQREQLKWEQTAVSTTGV